MRQRGRVTRVVVVVVVVVVVTVVVVAGLGGWTSCRWPFEWWCLDKRARIGRSDSKRVWRSGMGMDEVACE
jgi:hypothetical protein